MSALAAMFLATGAVSAAAIVAVPIYRLVDLFSEADFRLAVSALPKYLRDNPEWVEK